MTTVLVAILVALLGAAAGFYVGRRTGWIGAVASIFAPTTPAEVAANPAVSRAISESYGAHRLAAGQMLRVIP